MSANVKIPVINPIRFRPVTIGINYTTRYPRLDFMTQRQVYQKGVNANKYIHVDWQADKFLYFQLQVNSSPVVINAYMYGRDTTFMAPISWTNITPVGWVGFPCIQLSILPALTGVYYIALNIAGSLNENYVSDDFVVTNTVATDKNLVHIQYKNSYNKDGMIWGATYYNAFYTGMTRRGETQRENSISEEDDGTNIYNTTAYHTRILQLTQIHETQLDQIEAMLSNDQLIVNGEHCICKPGIESILDDKTDLYNVNATLTLKNIRTFMNFD